MILTDFHVHSDVSQDSTASMIDMVRAEAAYGIDCMCFTNHCDVVDWHTMEYLPRCREIVPESLRKREEMLQTYGPLPIDVRIGLELGESLFAPDVAREVAGSEGLDFVIGSLHILQGYGDLWGIAWKSIEQCHEMFSIYLDELLQIADMDWYDVMAHIGYARRYMMEAGFDAMMTLDRYGDRIEALLRRLIDKGIGIEINCSGIRDGCGPFPQPEVLRLYRQLGGEIITVGSDAHTPADAAKCVREGYEVLKDCGFRYVSTFKQRHVEFIKL